MKTLPGSQLYVMAHFYFCLMAGVDASIIVLPLYYEIYQGVDTPKLMTGKIITIIINTFQK